MVTIKQSPPVHVSKTYGELSELFIHQLMHNGRCTCEIRCRIAMAKTALNKKRALFTSTLDLELRKKLVKCYIWSIALYGAET